MSRKSVQRFCEKDMRKNKDLKRNQRIRKIATRFKDSSPAGLMSALNVTADDPKLKARERLACAVVADLINATN